MTGRPYVAMTLGEHAGTISHTHKRSDLCLTHTQAAPKADRAIDLCKYLRSALTQAPITQEIAREVNCHAPSFNLSADTSMVIRIFRFPLGCAREGGLANAEKFIALGAMDSSRAPSAFGCGQRG